MNDNASPNERRTRAPDRRPANHWMVALWACWRWVARTLTGSSAGTAPFEYVVVAGACSLCCLIAFQHFGTSLEAHERLQAERINAPKLPSADEYVNGFGAALDRPPGDDDDDDDDDDDRPMPACRLDGTCPGNGQCFAAGTPVATEAGLRAIETLRPGERVWARDVDSGELALQRITHTFTRQDALIIDLELRAGALSEPEHIAVTPSHRFWVEGVGWQRAEELVSTSVWSPEKPFFATALTQEPEPTTVYNLEVENFHSYFVGWSRVLVHNGDDDEDENDCQRRQREEDERARNDPNSPRNNPVQPRCFERPSAKYGIDGFQPRKVTKEEAQYDPRFEPAKDEDGNLLYDEDGNELYEANDDLKEEMMRQEEDRQLAAQQQALNGMTIDQYLDYRQAWRDRLNKRKAAGVKRPNGRPDDDAQSRAAERQLVIDALVDHYMRNEGLNRDEALEKALENVERTNALHKLDGIAGGDGTMHGLGNDVINQAIGRQWRAKANAMERWAKAMKRRGYGSQPMNVVLTYCT